MKNKFLTSALLLLLAACQSNTSTDKSEATSGVHTAVVSEVIQANQYTYLRVKENDSEAWLAVPKMEAKAGETYYYKGGLTMKDFLSKDLNRTFPEVLFIDNLSTSAEMVEKTTPATTPATSAEITADIPQEMGSASVPSEAHSIKATEFLQTTQYTYIHGNEGGKELWIAVAKMEGKVGKTYYFKGGLPMTDFNSKELKRTFKEVLFVDQLSENPLPEAAPEATVAQQTPVVAKGTTTDTDKKEVKISHSKTDLTIAKLFENKMQYAEKTIKIKGQVTKFNSGILKRNWIHIQDGTDFNGKFDLAITTNQEVKVGDVITVEGVIFLDKDFGFGYFYDVIMENAKLIQ